jgi:hypothetical protein
MLPGPIGGLGKLSGPIGGFGMLSGPIGGLGTPFPKGGFPPLKGGNGLGPLIPFGMGGNPFGR